MRIDVSLDEDRIELVMTKRQAYLLNRLLRRIAVTGVRGMPLSLDPYGIPASHQCEIRDTVVNRFTSIMGGVPLSGK